MALTKLTTDLIDGSLGTDWQVAPKTANFTAARGKGYLVDTTSTAITVTLPAFPVVGDEIVIIDFASNAATNNITIDPGTSRIRGATDDLVLSSDNQSVRLLYSDFFKGWLVTSEAGGVAGATAAPALIVDYLVVAGGGAGGYGYGGGGGAGGLRTSYGSTSGGGAGDEPSLNLEISTNYTVTIGAGGSYASSDSVNPDTYKGVSSSFSSISTVGGGGGGNQTPYFNGGAGGSGGGGSMPASTSLGGSNTANEGYSGGTGYRYGAGGGGGAQQLGENGGTDGVNYGGDGGSGLAVNILNSTNAGTASVGEISGSDVYYAGGGGGLGWTNTIAATGGIGGGGTGVVIGGAVGSNGANNSGGGGGGGQYNSLNGGSGGSGVVILRYPSEYVITVGSGIIEASGSPFTESTEKVSVFTGGTGTITFAEA